MENKVFTISSTYPKQTGCKNKERKNKHSAGYKIQISQIMLQLNKPSNVSILEKDLISPGIKTEKVR